MVSMEGAEGLSFATKRDLRLAWEKKQKEDAIERGKTPEERGDGRKTHAAEIQEKIDKIRE
jgi:hypothetical protein